MWIVNFYANQAFNNWAGDFKKIVVLPECANIKSIFLPPIRKNKPNLYCNLFQSGFIRTGNLN